MLAKEFWTIAIITSPGAMNTMNGTPATVRTAPPSAKAKIAKKTRVVTVGAMMVCAGIFMNRRISLAHSVHKPSQFTIPIGARPDFFTGDARPSVCSLIAKC